MVRSSRRQTLLRTTLPAVEHVEPSEGAALDFSPHPADEADQQTRFKFQSMTPILKIWPR